MPAGPEGKGIGTERESTLHAALKRNYAGDRGRTEVTAGGYVCDVLREDGEIIEIQTGSFAPLKEKAARLAETNRLRIVHPIQAVRHIEVYDKEGKLLRRRRSPRKGSPWDLFAVLVYAPRLLLIPKLTIELAMVEVAERRVLDGTGSWRRRFARISDRILLSCGERIPFPDARSLLTLLPFLSDEEFTVQDLAAKIPGLSPALARKALYVYHALDLVERRGKRRNAWIYGFKPGKEPKR